MSNELSELVLPSGRKLQVQSSAPKEAGVTPAAGGHAGQAIELAGDVVPAIEELAGTLIDKLAALAKGPETIGLELGIKLGGKTGIILAEGSAEANLKLTLTWKKP